MAWSSEGVAKVVVVLMLRCRLSILGLTTEKQKDVITEKSQNRWEMTCWLGWGSLARIATRDKSEVATRVNPRRTFKCKKQTVWRHQVKCRCGAKTRHVAASVEGKLECLAQDACRTKVEQ